jgi:hypothetical protein
MTDLANLRSLEAYDDASRPKGVWQNAPALAASTVAMTNTSGYPQEVGVYGGTVTAIVVDGVTIGGSTITGRFKIRRKGTIAITYSVAPTLQWIYL